MSLGFAWVHFDEPRGLRVHSSTRGFTPALMAVVEFIRVGVDFLWRTKGVVWFIRESVSSLLCG